MKLHARHVDVEGIRSIAELAVRKGFTGDMIDRAKMVVAEHDAQVKLAVVVICEPCRDNSNGSLRMT